MTTSKKEVNDAFLKIYAGLHRSADIRSDFLHSLEICANCLHYRCGIQKCYLHPDFDILYDSRDSKASPVMQSPVASCEYFLSFKKLGNK